MSRAQREKNRQRVEVEGATTFVLNGVTYPRCVCAGSVVHIGGKRVVVRVTHDIWPGRCTDCGARVDPKDPNR